MPTIDESNVRKEMKRFREILEKYTQFATQDGYPLVEENYRILLDFTARLINADAETKRNLQEFPTRSMDDETFTVAWLAKMALCIQESAEQ